MRYNTFMDQPEINGSSELLCPACGCTLTEKERTEGGWNCRCGEFIPEGLVVNPYKGSSCQHKQNRIWR